MIAAYDFGSAAIVGSSIEAGANAAVALTPTEVSTSLSAMAPSVQFTKEVSAGATKEGHCAQFEDAVNDEVLGGLAFEEDPGRAPLGLEEGLKNFRMSP